MSSASQLPIPDTADTSPDPVGNNTNTMFYIPNLAIHIPDFLYPIVSSISFSFSSPISLIVHHYSTIIVERKV